LKIAIEDMTAKNSPVVYKKNPFSYDENIIIIRKNSAFSTLPRWRESFVADIELSENNLDAGTFEVGNDYYIHYVYQNGTGNLIISLNDSYENGVVVGGFHYGHIRKVSNDGLWIPVDPDGHDFRESTPVQWEDNVTVGIVPNSVWDMKNRPKSSPAGMVKIGGIWVDIYIASLHESTCEIFERGIAGLHAAIDSLQSKYGKIPVTGYEDFNWYNFVEISMRCKKRLLTYNEWIKAVYGNPQGEDDFNNYGWTKVSNTERAKTGCNVNNTNGIYDTLSGIKPYAISAYNVVDGVGNVPEWTSNLVLDWSGEQSLDWYDFLGDGKGQYWGSKSDQVRAICAGGTYNDGVKAGCRSFSLSGCIWNHSQIGARFASESL
jgi:formylglycine-generating enzyme required for sulfatase activity